MGRPTGLGAFDALRARHVVLFSQKRTGDPDDLPACDVHSDARGIELVRALESDARWKDPTPGGLLSPAPGSLVDVEQAVANWLKAIAEGYNQLGAVYASQAWWKVQVFKHPIAGRLGLTDTSHSEWLTSATICTS